VTGLLFDPDLPGSLATAVTALVTGESGEAAALRGRMGAAGRLRVQERSWPALTDQLLEHYHRAMRQVPADVA
jgi:phosphatidylinositol alpha 1,6-mannosyltransferase